MPKIFIVMAMLQVVRLEEMTNMHRERWRLKLSQTVTSQKEMDEKDEVSEK